MATLIHCPTDIAVLLIAVKREDGLLVIPSDAGEVPGIICQVNTSLPINPQLLDAASKRTGLPKMEVVIWQEFQCEIQMPNGEPATVYAARTIKTPDVIPADAKPLPDLMRAMPANRNRVAYMKAMQVFSGALEEQTKALDLDEVRRHINSLSPKADT
jgi:hypothetical protein